MVVPIELVLCIFKSFFYSRYGVTLNLYAIPTLTIKNAVEEYGILHNWCALGNGVDGIHNDIDAIEI